MCTDIVVSTMVLQLTPSMTFLGRTVGTVIDDLQGTSVTVAPIFENQNMKKYMQCCQILQEKCGVVR